MEVNLVYEISEAVAADLPTQREQSNLLLVYVNVTILSPPRLLSIDWFEISLDRSKADIFQSLAMQEKNM